MLESIRRSINAAISKNPAGLKGESIAARMGVATSVLYRWGEHKDIPLWRFAQFVLITRAIGPLVALGRLCGCQVIPLPQGNETTDQAALEAIKAFSTFMEEDARDLLGGRVTPEQMAQLDAKGETAQLAIAHVIGAARGKVIA